MERQDGDRSHAGWAIGWDTHFILFSVKIMVSLSAKYSIPRAGPCCSLQCLQQSNRKTSTLAAQEGARVSARNAVGLRFCSLGEWVFQPALTLRVLSLSLFFMLKDQEMKRTPMTPMTWKDYFGAHTILKQQGPCRSETTLLSG